MCLSLEPNLLLPRHQSLHQATLGQRGPSHLDDLCNDLFPNGVTGRGWGHIHWEDTVRPSTGLCEVLNFKRGPWCALRSSASLLRNLQSSSPGSDAQRAQATSGEGLGCSAPVAVVGPQPCHSSRPWLSLPTAVWVSLSSGPGLCVLAGGSGFPRPYVGLSAIPQHTHSDDHAGEWTP